MSLKNLFARLKISLSLTRANVGPLLGGLSAVLLALDFFGMWHGALATPPQHPNFSCIAVDHIAPEVTSRRLTIVRYETQLTGFAEIDAPGRQSQPVRVVTNYRRPLCLVPTNNKADFRQNRSLLVLKSPLALPIAEIRPSLQDTEVRLQI